MNVPPLFAQRLNKIEEDVKFKNFLDMFKNLSINIHLLDGLHEIPKYSKFMKDLLTKKMSMDLETFKVSKHYSGIVWNNLVVKMDDIEVLQSI